jgi:membrane protease YdiL (CAAX protease family)
MNPGKIRLLELIAIALALIMPFIIGSVYSFISFGGPRILIPHSYHFDAFSEYNKMYMSITMRLGFILLCILLLVRGGLSLSKIGIQPDRKVIIHTVLLLLAVFPIKCLLRYLNYLMANALEFNLGPPELIPNFISRYDFNGIFHYITVFVFLFIRVIAEEVIFRAYLIFRLEEFIKSKVAVFLLALSVAVLAHIYQGWLYMGTHTVIFGLYIAYFIKFRRLLPIIVVHLLNNLIIVFL